MKAILEFDMDDHEEAKQHDFAARQGVWKDLFYNAWQAMEPESDQRTAFCEEAERLCLDLNDLS